MTSDVRGTAELVLSYLGLRRAIGVIGCQTGEHSRPRP